MAVMTTQHPEGARLEEAPLRAGKDELNGTLEINGHISPPASQRGSESAVAPISNGDTPVVDAKPSNKQEKQDASPAKECPSDHAKHQDEAVVGKRETEHDIASDMDKVKMEDSRPVADIDMPDAPAAVVPEDKASEGLSPKSHPKPELEAQPASDAPQAPEPRDGNESVADAPDASAGPAPPAQSEEKADVAMVDNEEQPEAPTEQQPEAPTEQQPQPPTEVQKEAPTKEHKEGPTVGQKSEEAVTTEVAASAAASQEADAPAATADSQNAQTDGTAGSPPAATTAETSMSETAQPSAKVSRERDIDSEDEPVAKRTKVDHSAEQVQVKTSPPPERMEVDEQGTAGQGSADQSSSYRANGEPKKLDDESLNDSPITEWQNKQIRQVLAGVKKTKVGALFRLPVQQLWPQLWADYSSKVPNPIDISMMEKRLRGDLAPYATMGEFKQDLDLLVQNAVTFNGDLHDVTLQAKACRDAILSRMALHTAAEPPKPERKESSKAHTTRHVEPRTAVPPHATAGAARQSKGGAASPAPKAVPESPAFAIPPNSNGMPLIRRDSTKPDNRAKRPVKPALSKDLVYDTKRKKKLPLDLRFCDEVLTELRKTKHYDINAAFLHPVDPVALNIPTYHKVIKKPMDLHTMQTKLNAGEYTSAKEFEKDFDLIIKNCRTFNGEDHIIYSQALRLQDLYRAEMSKKDEWMAKHAPASTAARAASRDDSESDDAESEGDDELAEERKQTENRLAIIQKRLDQEKKKVDDMVNSGTSDIADVEIAQSVVAMLQKQLMGERAKLATLQAKKPGKSKPAKSKKAGSGGAATSKKASAAVMNAGSAKKSGSKKSAPKRKIGQLEKEIIIESLGNLDGALLERAIDLIKRDTGHSENDAGELELDIETVSEEALVKLYDIALKANPNARADKERLMGMQASPLSAPPSGRDKPHPSKSKKNKPMSRTEQERRIQQLNELRAQAGRQASGSQEPLESIEGNGNSPAGQPEHESEDEVDSEED